MATPSLDEPMMTGEDVGDVDSLSAGHPSRYLKHATDLSGLRRSDVLKASPRMFDSKLLDSVSRVHPAVPPILFGPTIVFLLVWGFVKGAGAVSVALVLGGYLFWTLTEYWLHRIVFHFEPENPIGARLHWIIHGVHHDHPNDPMRLVMPPSVSVPLAALFLFGFYAVMGSPDFLPFSSGFLAGYLLYDMLHYHMHHHRPSTQLGRRLRELHMRHHFQNHERGYGVSAPFWDAVFGTFPKKRSPD
jgi:sterol desaturase/sphingolipid hydroxylase (fatty acid hydroxylase superfamily)